MPACAGPPTGTRHGRRARARSVAALLLAACAAVATPAAAQRNPRPGEAHFQAGRAQFSAGHHEAALAEFDAAIALDPSPNSLLYRARCLRELRRTLEAARAFERALARAEAEARTQPRYVATRDSARTELAALEPALGRVQLAVQTELPPGSSLRSVQAMAQGDLPQGASLRINDEEVVVEDAQRGVLVNPGEVRVVASAPGSVRVEQRVQVSAGAVERVELRLVAATTPAPAPVAGSAPEPAGLTPGPGDRAGPPPPPPPPPPTLPLLPPPPVRARDTPDGALRPVPWILAGTGVLGFATFAVLYVLTDARHAQLTECLNTGLRCPDDYAAAWREGQGLETGTNIALGVGIAGVLAAIPAFMFIGTGHGAPPVRIGLTPASVGLTGRF